jgi:hypothetical protein
MARYTVQEPEEEDKRKRYVVQEPEDAPAPSLREADIRQTQLGARNVVQGLAGIPGMFLDPFQQLVGMPTISGATNRLLTKAGLPEEVTDYEKLAGAGTRAIAGGFGAAQAARTIPAALKAAPEVINNLFAQKPLAQMFQAGVGGLAGEGTRQAGGNEWMQLLASATAPMAASGVVGAAQAAGRGLNELRRPITQTGANQIAADVLGKITQDKTAAISNLDDYAAAQARGDAGIIPDVNRTSGAASRDYGIIGGQRLAERGAAAPDFALRNAENNAAITKELQRLGANSEQVKKLETAREKFTAPLRDAALDNATGPVDYSPVAQKIVQLAGTPEGGAVESQKALQWLVNRLAWYQKEGRIDARNAYELEKDIGRLVAGKLEDPELGRLRLAGGLANTVKQELANQIEAVAPGFQKYKSTYRRFSQRLDRLDQLKELLGDAELSKVTNAGQVASSAGIQDVVSQAKVRNATTRVGQTIPVDKNGLPLAPFQKQVLDRVNNELDAQTLAASGGKPPGSDTFQNMASSNLFGNLLGEQLAAAGVPKLITAPMNLMYRPLEQRIRDIVAEAYLDPKKMAELLRIARTSRKSKTLGDLATSAEQNIYGGLLGGALAQ